MKRITKHFGRTAAAAVVAAGLISTVAVGPANADSKIYFSNQWWGCGTSISSSSVRLTFQCDGNLVLYQISTGRALWASGTDGWGVTRIVWAESGFDQIDFRDNSGNEYCGIPGAAANVGVNGYADVQNDGNFVLYNQSGHAVWASNTDGYRQGSTSLCNGDDYIGE
jgi:hypothetical protein